MKKYITPSVRYTDIELRNMIAASGLFMSKDDADTDKEVLVKEEDLTEEDLYRIFLGWD